jgi:hypothetical protein
MKFAVLTTASYSITYCYLWLLKADLWFTISFHTVIKWYLKNDCVSTEKIGSSSKKWQHVKKWKMVCKSTRDGICSLFLSTTATYVRKNWEIINIMLWNSMTIIRKYVRVCLPVHINISGLENGACSVHMTMFNSHKQCWKNRNILLLSFIL